MGGLEMRSMATLNTRVPAIGKDQELVSVNTLLKLPGYVVCSDFGFNSPEILYLSIFFDSKIVQDTTLKTAWSYVTAQSPVEIAQSGILEDTDFKLKRIEIDDPLKESWKTLLEKIHNIVKKYPYAVVGHNGVGTADRRGFYQINPLYFERVIKGIDAGNITSYSIGSQGTGLGLDASFSFYL